MLQLIHQCTYIASRVVSVRARLVGHTLYAVTATFLRRVWVFRFLRRWSPLHIHVTLDRLQLALEDVFSPFSERALLTTILEGSSCRLLRKIENLHRSGV